MRDAINIVGGGLAGSILAAVLRQSKMECVVFDDLDRYSASAASSNLFIASWLKKFSSSQAALGIKVLESLYGAKIDKPFESGIGDAMKVRHIAQRNVLVRPDVIEKVASIQPEGLLTVNNEYYHGPVVLCTGYRLAYELLPTPEVWVKVGHCYLFQGNLEAGKSRLAIVSPYTHEKLYQYDAGLIYYADSVAVKMAVYNKRCDELRLRTLTRARKLIGDLPIHQHRVGYRPFVTGHDFGYVSNPKPNVWVMNGGGKNGMVAYAASAMKIMQELSVL